MADDVQDFPLFQLFPESRIARKIWSQVSRNISTFPNVLLVLAKQTSMRRTGIITFGYDEDNDIHYGGPQRLNHIAAFTLTSNGDLVFVDQAPNCRPGVTALTASVTDAEHQDVDKYSMGACAGGRRVIAMCADFGLRVQIGPRCIFRFKWCVPLVPPAAVARTRARLAKIYAANPHKYDIQDVLRNSLAREAQNHPLHARPPPATHNYGKLDRDEPGDVQEMVDLRSGKVYAVKRLSAPPGDDIEDDVGAQQEWKRLARLQIMVLDSLNHTNIHPPQFMDGWAEEHKWLDLYYDLHHGNARDHFVSLRCRNVDDALVDHDMRLFVMQALQALAYLDAQRVVHGNIKPENVLFHVMLHHPTHQPPNKTLRFVLVDFAVGAARTPIGRPGYMAPETLYDHQVWPKADLYALGVTMLELLGVCEVTEFLRGMRYWYTKIMTYTDKTLRPDAGERNVDCEYGFKQVQALCEHGMLSAPLQGMLQVQ